MYLNYLILKIDFLITGLTVTLDVFKSRIITK